GLQLKAAMDTLKKYGYKPVKFVEEYSKDVPEGHIIWQRPEGESFVKPGRKVRLSVSLGKESITVPNLRGISYRQAIINLEKLGLIVGKTEYRYSDSISVDNVIGTIPPPFTKLSSKDTVNIIVSLGVITDKVFVPSFIGYPIDGLIERVKASGLYTDSTCITVRKIPTMNPGVVFQQSLYPGTQVPRNTKIEFIVNEGIPESE
ncbi:MAG: PASTA domain-containing protein, partial [bacterium]